MSITEIIGLAGGILGIISAIFVISREFEVFSNKFIRKKELLKIDTDRIEGIIFDNTRYLKKYMLTEDCIKRLENEFLTNAMDMKTGEIIGHIGEEVKNKIAEMDDRTRWFSMNDIHKMGVYRIQIDGDFNTLKEEILNYNDRLKGWIHHDLEHQFQNKKINKHIILVSESILKSFLVVNNEFCRKLYEFEFVFSKRSYILNCNKEKKIKIEDFFTYAKFLSLCEYEIPFSKKMFNVGDKFEYPVILYAARNRHLKRTNISWNLQYTPIINNMNEDYFAFRKRAIETATMKTFEILSFNFSNVKSNGDYRYNFVARLLETGQVFHNFYFTQCLIKRI